MLTVCLSQSFVAFDEMLEEADKENREPTVPEYLNESFGSSPKCVADDKALVRPGYHNSRDVDRRGWIDSVTSFFTNSFYW